MLALALFIAAGAPNAWALLVPARRVTRGSNRILSEASFEQFKLVAADAAEDDDVGKSVAIDGNTVVIGAPYRGNRGAVYVFRTSDGGATYVEVAKLTAADASSDDSFGWSVAIKGNTIVVGARGDDNYRGAAYVFRTLDGGATYSQVAKLTASDRATWDNFGVSVAIDGDTMVIGADGDNSERGSVYVFRTTDGGVTYGQVAKLTADDAAADDEFGGSVAIDGDTVVVGAYRKGDYTGAAYVYRTSDGGATYGQVAKLTASDAAEGDRFGVSVAIDGDTVVIGSSGKDSYTGSAYVFLTSDGAATYGQVAKLTAADAASGDQFGISVAIDGDTIVIGAYCDDDDGSCSGSVYVFLTSDGAATYGQVAKLTAADAAMYDYFGYSVAIDGNTIVIGAYGDDDAGDSSGSAYVFSGAGSEGLVASSDSAQTLGSDAATRTGPLLALLVAAGLAL
jgi:hypothetical protein